MEERKNKNFKSLIHKYFSKELLIKLEALTETYNVSNNRKVIEIRKILDEYNVPFSSLGNGTNRYGILIDGYVFKIALDRAGRIDNQREFKYAKPLYPYVIKTYESNIVLNVCEYVTIFSLDDFYSRQEEMKEILKTLSESYLIGDIGIDSNNYVNWGTRLDGSICILDYAYIYSLSYKMFECKRCEGGLLEFDENCVNLYCPICRTKYRFSDIRRRVSKEDEIKEIGDIYELGYIMREPEEEKMLNYDFSPYAKPKEKKIRIDRNIKQINQNMNISSEEQEKRLDYIHRLISN